MRQNKGLSEIVKRAVKRGYLSKGRGGGFPKEKTVYALPGYDFAADRALIVAEMMELAHIDAVTRKLR